MFFLAACKEHNLFERFAELPTDEIGYLFAYPVPWEQLEKHWHRHLHTDTKFGGIPHTELLKLAAVPKFAGDVYYPLGCFWTYPARHFHKHHPDFVNWMRNYAPYFGNDQGVATCWNAKFGIPLFPLDLHLQLRLTSTFPFRKDTFIFHNIIKSENEAVFRARLGV